MVIVARMFAGNLALAIWQGDEYAQLLFGNQL